MPCQRRSLRQRTSSSATNSRWVTPRPLPLLLPLVEMFIGHQGEKFREVRARHELIEQGGSEFELAAREILRFHFFRDEGFDELLGDGAAVGQVRAVSNPLPDL